MTIRTATEEDLDSILEIYRYYVRTSIATLEEQEPSSTDFRKYFDKIFSSNSPFIVAVDPSTNNICGYAYSGPYHGRSGYRFTSETSVYVHQDHCGKGLGKRIMQELFERLKQSSGIKQVVVKMSIFPDQTLEDLPTCRLHKAFGFFPVGRLFKIGYKFDKWIDVVVMQAELENIKT